MFAGLAQITGALLKRFLERMICLVSRNISLPEHVLNQDYKIFSTCEPTQIFFADLYLAHSLPFTTEHDGVSSAKSFIVHRKLCDKSLI